MNHSRQAERQAYRRQMRRDFRSRGFWIFAAGIYGMTFLIVAVISGVGQILSAWLSPTQTSPTEISLTMAFFWAKLIFIIFLVSVAVLYLRGGSMRTPKSSSDRPS